MRMTTMRMILTTVVMLIIATFSTACETQEVPPGHKGFNFDSTGSLAFYAGGTGLQTDVVLEDGTHYTGFYDRIVGVNCRDAHVKEPLSVLTQSDMEVTVDLRVTYSADCASQESIDRILDKVGVPVGDTSTASFVQPPQIFEKYVMPVIRESLRNHLADSTLEEVKDIRGELAIAVKEDLLNAVEERNFPVNISVLTVSKITLPKEIRAKIKEIEIARMEANKEHERMAAAKVRLEREYFEAEQERKVAQQQTLKEKEVKILQAEAQLEERRLEAQGIREIRRQLSGEYLDYLRLERETEVKKAMAASLGQGTTYYLSGTDFLVPPGSSNNVSVTD